MSFNYTLKRTIVKHSEQTFNKLLVNKVELSVNSQPDNRDEQFYKLTPEDRVRRQELFTRIPLIQPPFNRVWLDDNTVELDHYFDTIESAKIYYNWRIDNIFDSSEYETTYILLDADNNSIPLT
jgi:hypothetical protein